MRSSEARLTLIEAATGGDDNLLEKYFAEEELTMEEIVTASSRRSNKGLCTPIMFAAGSRYRHHSCSGSSPCPGSTAPNEQVTRAIKPNGNEAALKGVNEGSLAAFILRQWKMG